MGALAVVQFKTLLFLSPILFLHHTSGWHPWPRFSCWVNFDHHARSKGNATTKKYTSDFAMTLFEGFQLFHINKAFIFKKITLKCQNMIFRQRCAVCNLAKLVNNPGLPSPPFSCRTEVCGWRFKCFGQKKITFKFDRFDSNLSTARVSQDKCQLS